MALPFSTVTAVSLPKPKAVWNGGTRDKQVQPRGWEWKRASPRACCRERRAAKTEALPYLHILADAVEQRHRGLSGAATGAARGAGWEEDVPKAGRLECLSLKRASLPRLHPAALDVPSSDA